MVVSHAPFVPLGAEEPEWSGSAFRVACSDGLVESLIVMYRKDEKVALEKSIVPVRIHSSCITGEVFGSQRCDCAWQLNFALDYFRRTGLGIAIYLPGEEGCGNGILAKLRSFALMDSGYSSPEAYAALGLKADKRTFSEAVEILKWLGIKRIDILTNNPKKIEAVERGGIEIRRRVPCIIEPRSELMRKYLLDKKYQLGHLV